MTLPRPLLWILAAVAVPPALAVLFLALFGWNWLRAPIERAALDKTGRVLSIQGDLTVAWGWPSPRLRAAALNFANPAWASEPQMVSADAVEISVDLAQLLQRHLVFPEVSLGHAKVFLEQGTAGRKSWLLDLGQQDENASVRIGRLSLDHATLGFDDAVQKTRIRADLSTLNTPPTVDAGVAFNAQGTFRGLPLKAQGTGGPVLALRDEATPYALVIDATVGQTRVRANGTITSLLKISAMDMQMALSGDSLEQLYVLLGIALPRTRDYVLAGRLVHTGTRWSYDRFVGRMGLSDVAGSVQVDTGGVRPVLTADLRSTVLDLAELGPLIGARTASVAAARKEAAPAARALAETPRARVLPDLPFDSGRWNTLDAEVSLHAGTIRRDRALPLQAIDTHLSLRDSVIQLDPLDFTVAGGHFSGVVTLDGKRKPIQARARMQARKLQLAQMFPTFELGRNSIGELNGRFDLTGSGNSVGSMLAGSSGNVGLVVVGGEISQLMMEKAGLHLWEILQLNLSGDRQVKLRCAVADFDVRRGTMQVDALVFDTAVTTLLGTGQIDLANESVDITLNQKTKNTSIVALRSPIRIHGPLAQPLVEVDKTRLAARALGALALGVVNPFLALIPLIDAGPGKDSDCALLVSAARAQPPARNPPAGPLR